MITSIMRRRMARRTVRDMKYRVDVKVLLAIAGTCLLLTCLFPWTRLVYIDESPDGPSREPNAASPYFVEGDVPIWIYKEVSWVLTGLQALVILSFGGGYIAIVFGLVWRKSRSWELCEEFMAYTLNDRPKAKELLKQHPEVLDARCLWGETALHYLAIENYGDEIRFLCELGFDVNVTDFTDMPVLLSVALGGHVDIARTLLEFGAEPNASHPYLDNALHWAASGGSVELVDLLLEHGADGSYENELGENIFDAIIEAPPSVKEDMLRVLDKHGVERRRPMHDLLESGDYGDDPRGALLERKDED